MSDFPEKLLNHPVLSVMKLVYLDIVKSIIAKINMETILTSIL